MENAQELWQVEANGKIFETSFAELMTWIDEGSLLREDKVRKGNLRWIQAGKVPPLIAVFNAKENGRPIAPVVTTTSLGPSSFAPSATTSTYSEQTHSDGDENRYQNAGQPAPPNTQIPSPDAVCSMHNDKLAEYVCETCVNTFCKVCPTSYGTKVRVCPFCGAMCKSIFHVDQAVQKESVHRAAISEGFGFTDFWRAVAYPFRFKISLFFGAVMFMFFSVGQAVTSFGGIFMMVSAIFCMLLANMITFGVMANTVDNFTQGKLDDNFMPSFDDFSLWEDIVHPFFLSIGVYLASFGPLIAVAIVAVFMIAGSTKTEMNPIQADAARLTNPDLPYAAKAADQTKRVRELLNKTQEERKGSAQFDEHTLQPLENAPHTTVKPQDQEDADFDRIGQTIQDARKAQLESAIGKTPETVAAERTQLFSKLLAYGLIFIIVGGVCLLWGLFYFPAACAVAAYTRSFMATMNPMVGLDTVRHLGSYYFKILLCGLVLLLASIIVSLVLGFIFSPFDLPRMGNIPALAVGSLFSFYLSVVFSCVLGYALYKGGDRLQLPKG